MKKLWERSPISIKGVGHNLATLAKPQGQIPAPLPWTERWLRHRRLPLAGRPDVVDRMEGDLWVVDLKTGLSQSEPSPAQRQQLLFYCELVRSEVGQFPKMAAVESTRGERYSFRVEPDEAQEVVDRALAMLNTLNSAWEGGLSDSLANPSESTCGWCPFRPVCGPFFNAYEQSWPIAHALLFRVDSLNHGLHGYEVEATVVQPLWRKNEGVHVVGFPFDVEPRTGDLWGAADFAGRANSAVAAWNTRLAKWGA